MVMNLNDYDQNSYEKLAFVDSVCAALIDSRYGHGRSNMMFRSADRFFEIEPEAFVHDIEDGILPRDVSRRRYRRECAGLAERRRAGNCFQVHDETGMQISSITRTIGLADSPDNLSTARPPPI